MASIQFKIWSALIKAKFAKQDQESNINISKARRFDTPEPTPRIQKKASLEKQEILGRNVFFVNKKHDSISRVLLYFHGGAFLTGITKLHWNFIEQLSSTPGNLIVIPEYPISPEADHQKITIFIHELYKHLLNKYSSIPIYVIGDSAGGNLSLALSQILKENNLPQPEKIILLSPWVDISLCNPEIQKYEKQDIMLSSTKLKNAGILYAGKTDIKSPVVSPIYGNLGDLPETHIFSSDKDLLFPDSIEFKARAEELGRTVHLHEFKEMMHVWMLFPIPEAKKAIKKIIEIVQEEV